MKYFQNFPTVEYTFGENLSSDNFQNIAIFADVVDQVKDVASAYEDYHILPGERPDQVSFQLYDVTDYHWTFALMNPKIREQGWPLSTNEVYNLALAEYSELVLTTRTKLTDKFKLGQTVSGNTSGHSGIIQHRELDLGQIWLKNKTGNFSAGETVQSTNSDGVVESITLQSAELRYNAAHHYESGSEHVDIDPEVGPGSNTEITWLERLTSQNDSLKQIRVLKSSVIKEVVDAFKKSVRI